MPSLKPYPFRNSKLETHEEGRARGRPCEYRQTKPLRSLSRDSILLFPLARHIHILQWELLLAEQCTLTIYLSQQPHDCLPRRALEISSSLRLHKIARGIFRMKAIRGWRILKLFMSLFLKERIALKYWHLDQSMRICLILSRLLLYYPAQILIIFFFFFFLSWEPMNVLRPTDQRTLTWTESETENAWWLTQLEVDPGRYLNPLLKCPQNTCCIL